MATQAQKSASRLWYIKNKDRIQKNKKIWIEKNPDRAKKMSVRNKQAWDARNPEKVRENNMLQYIKRKIKKENEIDF